jgi:WS/DGAT/MGAT family acyltransferase
MEELSGLDASFLYLESAKMPMHIGQIAIIEGTLTFDDFKTYFEQRLHEVDRLRQKLVFVPLNIDRPHWVQDPNFDLDMHLIRTALPQPGNWKELRYLASKEFSKQLSKERPLWEFIFVEGVNHIPQVPEGSVALLSKMHHAGFDGKAGLELISMLFDSSSEIRQVSAPQTKSIETMPGWLELMTKGVANVLLRPTKLPGLLWETGKATLKAGYLNQIQDIDMPTLPFGAPHTCINDTVDVERKWDSAILDLARIKAIRKAVDGTTINDVVLAVCAGALRRYLLEKNDLPDEPLVAMVPISIRAKEQQKDTLGNQLSAMFIQLATNVEQPLIRLQKIQINTSIGKLYQDVVAAKSLMDYAELVPFGLAGIATRLYSHGILAKQIKPPFNLIITNVPGPQTPLYLAGHKLIYTMGTGPICDGAGLIIPVLSYNGTLTISPTSCEKLMPDIELFCRYIRESANELELAALEKVQADKGLEAADNKN